MYKSGKEYARGEKSWCSTKMPHVCTNVKRVFEGREKLVSHRVPRKKIRDNGYIYTGDAGTLW
jgi:hypothetical protein